MKKILAPAIVLAFCVGCLGAQTALTVESAVASALKNNISIERGKITLSGLERTANHSWNDLVPSLSIAAGGSKDNDADYASVYGSATASVSFSPALTQTIRLAQSKYAAGKITYETAVRSVELSVRKAFYSLLYAKANIARLKGSVDTAKKQYEQTLTNQKYGRASELEVLQAQVTLENLNPTLASAEVSYQNNLASFKQTVGIAQGESLSLEGSLDEVLTLKAIDISSLSVSSATVASLEKSVESAKISLDAARMSAYMPVFSLSYALKQTTTTASGSASVDSGVASASVTLPLDGYLPFSSSADAIAAAKETVRDLELQLANQKTTTDIEISSYMSQIQQSLITVKARKLSVALAEKSVKMTEEAYNKGTADLLTLQDANDSLQEAQVSLMSEEYTLISAILELENAIGVPFGTLGRN